MSLHVNNSTKLTLNDRFTLMQNVVGPTSTTAKRAQSPRRRRNSQSGATNFDMSPKASYRNRQLVDQLEKRHKIVAAMKIKKKSIRTNMIFRQKNKVNWRNASKSISISPGGKLRRTNSLTNLATMKADLFTGPATRLRRSNSVSNLAARLGNVNRRGFGNQRGRINRSNSFSNLKRSNSKQNLARSNSRTNLARSNSRTNLSNSQTNLNRSNSQTRLNYNNGNPQRRKLNRTNFRQRSNSVNSRLGVNRTNTPNLTGRRGRGRGSRGGGGNIVRGRVFRRSAPGGNAGNIIGTENQQGRLGRSRIRGQINNIRGQTRFRSGQASVRGQSINRGRSRSRSRNRLGNIQNSGNKVQRINGNKVTRGRGGRGRGNNGRGSVRGGGASVRAGPPVVKSKEELDQELEQYMANTKTHLDKEMDEYMRDVTY